jgi:hypothetical protein
MYFGSAFGVEDVIVFVVGVDVDEGACGSVGWVISAFGFGVVAGLPPFS